MTSSLDLTVAVLTYRRPHDLAAILPALLAQVASARSRVSRARLLVVDNSPEAAARAAVETFADGAALAATEDLRHVTISYEHEPAPGIPAARNCALRSSAESDLLVFIDDDERPQEHWLGMLLDTFVTYGAVAVVGAVVSEFEVTPDEWIVAGRFFDRRRLPTGTPLTVAATNNLLIDLRVTRSVDLRFDQQMGMNGGDDTLFTRELARHGLMVWCDEAVVIDVVPRARVTRDWVVRRSLRSGNSWSLTSVRIARSRLGEVRARVGSIASGIVRIVGGIGRVLVGVVARRLEQRARGVRTLARGAGMVLGACGLSYLEYQRPSEGRTRRIAIARR